MKTAILAALFLSHLLFSSLSFSETLPFNGVVSGPSLTITTGAPNHTYPHAGMYVSSSGFTVNNCTNTLGWCPFNQSISDTTSYSATITGPSGPFNLMLALSTKGQIPVTTQLFPIPERFLYICGSSVVDICNINTPFGNNHTTAGSLTSCGNSGGTGFEVFAEKIILSGSGMLAFVANQSNGSVSTNSVSVCAVNATSGGLSNCTTYNYFDGPGGLALDPTGTKLYVANTGSGTPYISVCAVNPSNGAISACVNAGPSSAYTNGLDVVLDFTGSYAYLANSSSISRCIVDTTTGLLSECIATGNNMSDGRSVAFNTSGANPNYLYVNDAESRILICLVNRADGTLSDCNPAGTNGVTLGPGAPAFAGYGTLAYLVSNGTPGVITVCSVDPVSGYFSGCTPAASVAGNRGVVTR